MSTQSAEIGDRASALYEGAARSGSRPMLEQGRFARVGLVSDRSRLALLPARRSGASWATSAVSEGLVEADPAEFPRRRLGD